MEPIQCPGCGKRSASEQFLDDYRYIESGLPGVTLHGGAVETTCNLCDERFYHVVREGEVLQLIAVALLTSPNRLHGPELRYLREACNLRQQQLAERLKCRRATVAERERSKKSKISDAEQVWIRLVLLNEFRKHLADAGDLNFLSSGQTAGLDNFEREFIRRALPPAKRPAGQFTLDVWLREDGAWDLERAA